MNTDVELAAAPGAVERIAELAREAGKPFEINGTPYVMVPDGTTLVAKPEDREIPARIEQTIALHTPGSFVTYYKSFCAHWSVVIFDLERARYTAIFDYHIRDGGPESPEPLADWCRHRAIYECPQTPEWKVWLANNSKAMNQTEFAFFIEQNVDDIRTPAGAEMLEIVTTLKAKTKVAFNKAIRLASGQNELTYNEVIDGKAGAAGRLRIPEEIVLGITPFQGGEAYAVRAKFRYRIEGGDLRMWYDLMRPHKVDEAALADITAKIAAGMEGVGMFLEGRVQQ